MEPPKAATCIVIAALVGSPRVGEGFTPFVMREASMVSTTMSSHGVSGGATSIPTNTSTSTAGTARASPGQKRSSSSTTPPYRFYGAPEEAAIRDPASPTSLTVDNATTPLSTAQLPSTPAPRDQLPPLTPPEPGGGEGKTCNRPWRKRARDARRDTVIENTGFRPEGLGEGGCGDGLGQRACEKEEGVVASRKDRAQLPMVDLVVVMFPLIVIIVWMSFVQKMP